jgi:hypothetical protein
MNCASCIAYNMAPVLKYVNESLLSLSRLWTGNQLFIVPKVTEYCFSACCVKYKYVLHVLVTILNSGLRMTFVYNANIGFNL